MYCWNNSTISIDDILVNDAVVSGIAGLVITFISFVMWQRLITTLSAFMFM